jgi:hypothetical protein
MTAHSPFADLMVMFAVETLTFMPSVYVPLRNMIVPPADARDKAVLMLLYGLLDEPLPVVSLPLGETYIPPAGSS